jgi:hypothetical protein
VKLSDFGSIAARMNLTNKNLELFNNAIDRIRSSHAARKDEQQKTVSDLLSVLKPLADNLSGKFSDSISLDESSVSEILRQKHNSNWQEFREDLVRLNDKLQDDKLPLLPKELVTLEEVADAMEAECAQLFNRISGRS